MGDLLSLSELAKRLPCVRGSKPPNRSTLYRWATVGLKSRSGQRIRLQTQFVGGTLCAGMDDVSRLCDSLDDVEPPAPPVYRNKREEERMRREADKSFAMAMAI